MFMQSVRGMLRHSVLSVLILTALGGAATAQTTTFFKPDDGNGNPTDIFDLDHHYLYTWRIGNIDLTDQTIVGATLRFKDIANWRVEPNVLHIHMFDTARRSGVRSFLDDNPNDDNNPGNNGGVVDLTDDFKNTRYHNGTDAQGNSAEWLIAPGTAGVFIEDKSFGTTPTTYSINLATAGFLDELNAYILNGNNVAFGFDSDCHFNNSGIELEVVTVSSRVPEPATLALLGITLPLVGCRIARRRK